MQPSFRKIYITLFLLGLFFIPFNSFEGIKELGEFKRESGAYFLLLGFLLLAIESSFTKRISIPYKSFAFQILVFFLLWCCLTTLINAPGVITNFYKKTTGTSRFIRQLFALVLSTVFFFLLYWNVIVKMSVRDAFELIRKALLYSFVFVAIYGFLEIAFVVYNFFPAYTVLQLFDYFPFTEYDADMQGRISSVAYEPPFLAIYLITVAGWMFSYVITHKSFWRFVPGVVLFILTYFSGSRTALIVILIQACIFFSVVLTYRQKVSAIVSAVGVMLLFVTFVLASNSDKILFDLNKKIESLDFKSNLKKSVSNQSRFGIQYANLQVFAEHPVTGVGFGQQGFHARQHYPIWATKDNWEFIQIYSNKTDPMFPPGYNLYIRLLAETGLIGFSIFCFLLFYLISQVRRLIKRDVDSEIRPVAIVLYVSFVGFAINWMQIDSFRIYGFWLCLALFIRLIPFKTQLKNHVPET